MPSIAEYLDVTPGCHTELNTLYLFHTLPSAFSPSDIFSFYVNYKNTSFYMNSKALSCGEVIASTNSILESLDDLTFSFVTANYFVDINGLDHWELPDVCDNPKTFLKKLYHTIDTTSTKTTLFRLTANRRAISMIEEGILHYEMFLPITQRLKLTPFTFKHCLKNGINIPELMTYNLSYEDALSLTSKVRSDSSLKASLSRHIKEQGIHNETMFIVAAICGYANTVHRNISYQRLDGFFCLEHSSEIVRSISDFEDISGLEPLEGYYMYLKAKKSIKNDKDSIIVLLSQDFGLLPDKDAGCLLGILELCFINKIKIPEKGTLFYLILLLEDKAYFRDILEEYLPSFIRYRIFPEKYRDEVLDGRAIINFLASKTSLSFCENEPSSDLLFSSLEEYSNNEKQSHERPLPLVSFKVHKWLTASQKELLMDEYTRLYSVRDLVDNYLSSQQVSAKTSEVFIDNLNLISNPVKKGLVMCKAGIEIMPGSFSKEVLKLIYEKADNIFALRSVVMFEDVSMGVIKKFYERLNSEQEDCVVETMASDSTFRKATDSFCLIHLKFLTQKYDFSFVYPCLINYIERLPIQASLIIQAYLISLLSSMYLKEEYFEYITALYHSMIRIKSPKVQQGCERILFMVLEYGKVMNRDVFIGNVKTDGSK